MKILFVLASPEYLRFFDTAIALLAGRGHEAHVVFDQDAAYKPVGLSGAGALPLASVTVVPAARTFWADTAYAYRASVDFLRFLHPDFDDAGVLRERMRRKVLPAALQWLSAIPRLPVAVLNGVLATLRLGERAIPVDPRVQDTLTRLHPDLVVVSPLVDAASAQVDWVKGARAQGTPSAVAVASWDNLTNKGLMRIRPDRVLVWNEIQRREAVRYHAVPAERVIVTGAAVFDRWFDRRPASSRDALCRGAGLTDTRPFVLFTGSSAFIADAQAEVAFVQRWIQALRSAADPDVRNLQVVVRPHPYNTEAWAAADLGDEASTVWPRGAFNPASEEGRRDLFDSLSHAAAVVGINTTAMIEAAIVGRPVLTVTEFATQGGTLHFRYLLREHGGPVTHGSTLAEHVAQLGAALRRPAAEQDAANRFVESFVRPHGLHEASAPRLVAAIEETAALRVPARTAIAARVILSPAVAAFGVWVAVVARLSGPNPLAPVRKHVLDPLRTGHRRMARQAGRIGERASRRARLAASRMAHAQDAIRARVRGAPSAWKTCRRAVRQARYTLGTLWRGTP